MTLLLAALSRCASVGSSNIGGGGAAAGHHRFGRDHVNIDIGGSGDAGYSSWGGGGGGGGGGCDSGGGGGGGGFSIGRMAVDTSIIVVAISAEKDDVGYHVGGGGIASGR
ncbi:uncharacterized protein LOC105779043 [Gossypium raimondii]|uniref:uncharacterized protein LOC105779043 n=1 Tax=Gossypium raimondii TaxID=29730 RepID=UPI00063AD4C8|nr:uncharacterized protein LOC105779043 [Gossypium raimondii]